MKIHDIVNEILHRPVAFYPLFGRIAGSASAGLLLSQAYYWSQRTKDENGWFYKTQAEWQRETCLTRHEQDTCRRDLRERGLLHERLRSNPAKLFYRVDVEAIAVTINRLIENQQTSLGGLSEQQRRKPTDKLVANQQTLFAEKWKTYRTQRLQEITAETTSLHPGTVFSHVGKTAEVVIFLTLNDKREYPIAKDHIAEWVKLYPATDVLQELRNMRGWLLANPSKRKTQSGIMRFVNHWLAKAQNNAGGGTRGVSQNNHRPSGAFHSGERHDRRPDSEM